MPNETRRNAFLKIFGRRPRRDPPPLFELESTTTLIEDGQQLTPENHASDVPVPGDGWGATFPGGLPSIDVDARLAEVKRRFHSDRDYKAVLKKCNSVYTLAGSGTNAEEILAVARAAFKDLRKYVVGLEKRHRKSATDQRRTKLQVWRGNTRRILRRFFQPWKDAFRIPLTMHRQRPQCLLITCLTAAKSRQFPNGGNS